jgi:hypothetical protein
MSKNPTAFKKGDAQPRKLKTPKYQSFRLQKKLTKPQVVSLPSSFKLLKRSIGTLKTHWKLFGGIVVVYAVLNLLLVQSFFGIDIGAIRENIGNAVTGWNKFASAFSSVTYMFSNSGTANSSSAYRVSLMAVGSLAVIWGLRQVLAGNKVRIRDAFYQGMYPLVPFLLIFLVLSVQLVPLAGALYLFYMVGASGGMEVILWALVLASLVALTLYMLSASLFALYVVCLPNMQPLEALRSATDLVRHRRLPVVRRILFLPLALGVIVMAVMIPIIFFATHVAVIVFFILLMAGLPVVHSYMYALYRELLNEG